MIYLNIVVFIVNFFVVDVIFIKIKDILNVRMIILFFKGIGLCMFCKLL